MIPSSREVLAGYRFWARRWDMPLDVSEAAIEAALDEARELAANDEAAEPAAVFYAFARRPRLFRSGWARMAILLADNQARSARLEVHADPGEYRRLCTRIAQRREDFEAVRAWFAQRLQPRR